MSCRARTWLHDRSGVVSFAEAGLSLDLDSQARSEFASEMSWMKGSRRGEI